MRVLRLDRCAALREVGFNIEEDGVVAKITGQGSNYLAAQPAHATVYAFVRNPTIPFRPPRIRTCR